MAKTPEQGKAAPQEVIVYPENLTRLNKDLVIAGLQSAAPELMDPKGTIFKLAQAAKTAYIRDKTSRDNFTIHFTDQDNPHQILSAGYNSHDLLNISTFFARHKFLSTIMYNPKLFGQTYLVNDWEGDFNGFTNPENHRIYGNFAGLRGGDWQIKGGRLYLESIGNSQYARDIRMDDPGMADFLAMFPPGVNTNMTGVRLLGKNLFRITVKGPEATENIVLPLQVNSFDPKPVMDSLQPVEWNRK
jgi:hypothetical protein